MGFAYDLNGHGNHIVRAGFGMYYDNTFQNIPLFMEQQANNTIFQTAFGIGTDARSVPGTGFTLANWNIINSPFPVIPAASSALNPGSTGRLMDPNYRTPVTEECNGGYTWAINVRLYSKRNMFTCSACTRTRPLTWTPIFRSIPTTSPRSAEPVSRAASSVRWTLPWLQRANRYGQRAR